VQGKGKVKKSLAAIAEIFLLDLEKSSSDCDLPRKEWISSYTWASRIKKPPENYEQEALYRRENEQTILIPGFPRLLSKDSIARANNKPVKSNICPNVRILKGNYCY
jgi:hypothetical protein